MKALMLRQYGRVSCEDVPEPPVGPSEVLVQVKACGICGSDVHGLDGSTGRRVPPVIMGHEAAGVITQVGEQVEGWQPGDRVTFDSTIFCGACPFCRRGQVNLCERRQVLGVSCDGYRRDGAFAEYVAVPQHIVYRLPEDLSFTRAALVEPLSVALHAVSLTPVERDDTALVMGAGVIGLLLIQALRAAGCGRIIAVDLNPARLELALGLGATHVLRGDQPDVIAETLRLTEDRGADVAFDAVGVAITLNTAIGCLHKGGALTLIGNLAPAVDFPLQAVVARQIRVQGSCASAGEYPAGLDLIRTGTVQVDPLISATAPLRDGDAWFQRLYQGESGLIKVILEP